VYRLTSIDKCIDFNSISFNTQSPLDLTTVSVFIVDELKQSNADYITAMFNKQVDISDTVVILNEYQRY
jgi:hypothetical protein